MHLREGILTLLQDVNIYWLSSWNFSPFKFFCNLRLKWEANTFKTSSPRVLKYIIYIKYFKIFNRCFWRLRRNEYKNFEGHAISMIKFLNISGEHLEQRQESLLQRGKQWNPIDCRRGRCQCHGYPSWSGSHKWYHSHHRSRIGSTLYYNLW